MPPTAPMSQQACTPTRVASRTSASVRPSITISITDSMPGEMSLRVMPRMVGQKASLVDAISALYLLPTLEPERTTPPGKGITTLGSFFMASMAASQAASACGWLSASTRKLPPPTARTMPVVSSTRNSPSITGMRQ